MKYLNSSELVEQITNDLKDRISRLSSQPVLSIVQIGKNVRSKSYIDTKMNKAVELGIRVNLVSLSKSLSQKELENEVERLNDVSTGIIIQLPVPTNIDKQSLLDKIENDKDVDAINSYHVNRIQGGDVSYVPATPRGVFELLDFYNITLKQKDVVVIGNSSLVGMPIAKIAKARGASVTVMNKETGVTDETKVADIIFIATGVKSLVNSSQVKPGVVIVDIGVTIIDSKVHGDFDRENLDHNKPSWITPRTKGVGPMTVISLFQNLIE